MILIFYLITRIVLLSALCTIVMFIADSYKVQVVRMSSIQSLDRLGHRGDMMDDPTENLFQSFLHEVIVSHSGRARMYTL